MKLSFKDRAKIAEVILSKQPPVSLEDAKKQVEWLKMNSDTNIKKGHDNSKQE